MVDFIAPLGLRTEGGEQWNIDIVDDSSVSNGNLTFNANALAGGNKFLEIDDESGNIGIGVDISSFLNPAKLRIDAQSIPNGIGIVSRASAIGIVGNGIGVNGTGGIFSGGRRAAVFVGDIEIFGGLILSGASTVSIDNPLDPENKSLNHANVISSEMLDVYSGNVILDDNGEAIVELAEWVEAVNKDFRYQLTCIGGYSDVYIAQEVSNNSFRIAGGLPNTKVSWQLTGVRQDPWAKAHPLVVEQDKPKSEKGYYQSPDLYNQPEEKSTVYARQPEIMEQLQETKSVAP